MCDATESKIVLNDLSTYEELPASDNKAYDCHNDDVYNDNQQSSNSKNHQLTVYINEQRTNNGKPIAYQGLDIDKAGHGSTAYDTLNNA